MLDGNQIWAGEDPVRSSWWGLGALSLGMVLLFMNTTMINVALPDLAVGLPAGTRELEWIVSSYNLAFLSALLIGGAVGDRIGHRRTLACGIMIFCGGALVAVLGGRVIGLLVARVLMGLGASVVTPMSLALIRQMFGPARRGTATGVWTAAGALGAPLGPLVGGAMIDAHGWRAMFVLDVAVGLVVLALCRVTIPGEYPPGVPSALPWSQVLASASGFALLTWGLISAEGSWTAPSTWVPLAVGGVMLSVFTVLDLRATSPLTNLRLLRAHRFRGPALALLLVNIAQFGLLFVTPNYLQVVLGHDAMHGGLMLMPLAATGVLGSLFSGALLGRGRARPGVLPAALVVTAAGLWVCARACVAGGYTPMFWGLTVTGFGLGLAQSFGIAVAMSAVQDDTGGAGAALLNALRQLGSVLGTALLGSLAGHRYSNALPPSVDALPAGIAAAVHETIAAAHTALAGLPEGIAAPVRVAADTAYLDAMAGVLVGCALLVLLAGLAGLGAGLVRRALDSRS